VVSQPSGYPTLIAVDASGRPWASQGLGPGSWNGWRRFGLPRKGLRIRDADALEGGVGELFVVATDGSSYRRRIVGTSWGKWVKLGGPSAFTGITAVQRSDGSRLVVETASPSGAAVLRAQTGPAWKAPFGPPLPFGQLVEGDLTRDRSGALRAFGYDPSGTLRTRAAPDGVTWTDWTPWEVRLFAPQVANPALPETTGPPLDGIVQLEATQWIEAGEADATVVFALDFRGNVYLTEPRCTSAYSGGACTGAEFWRGWRSFY
jgi:hypothetical protein